MLQNLREKAQSWVAYAIIFFICLSFALWGIHNYVTGGNQDEAAKVNGEAISQKEVGLQFDRLKQNQLQLAQSENQTTPVLNEKALKQQALEATISQHVLSATAKKDGYFISDTQLQEVLSAIPVFQIDGQFNDQRFQQVLSDVHYTPQGFLQDVQKALMLEQVRKGFLSSAFVLPEDAARAVALIEQQRDITYTAIPASHYKNQVHVTLDEVRHYYQTHQAEFMMPEKVKIAYVTMRLSDIKKQIKLTDADLKQYYQDNINNFTRPTRWHLGHIQLNVAQSATKTQRDAALLKAQSIITELKNGADFAQLARKYSDDIISSRLGGELGWFSANHLDPPMHDVVASLHQPGAISAPLATSYGISIYKLFAIEEEQIEPFDKVKSQIELVLMEQKAEQKFYEKRDEMANMAFAQPDNLNGLAQNLNLNVQTTDWFSVHGEPKGILANPAFVHAAFDPDVLAGNNSQVVELDPETVTVVRMQAHEKAAPKPLQLVAKTINDRLYTIKLTTLVAAQGQSWLTRVQQTRSLTALGLPLQQAKNIKRSSRNFDPNFIAGVFRLPKPEAGQAGSFAGFALPNGDYIIARTDRVTDGQLEGAAMKEKQFVQQQLQDGFGQLDYAFYVQSAMHSADIKINS